MEKSRYWTFVIYEDSCPDYLERIKETHVACFISPWHDQDVNPDGELKKKHRHCMACWDGPTTEKNVQKVFGSIACNGVIQVVASARGMYRYFTHKDNPEKHQYDECDIISVNGADATNIMSETDKNNVAWDIGQIIINQNITEYGELCCYLMRNGERGMLAVLESKTSHFQAFIRSRRHAIEYAKSKVEDEQKAREKIKRLEAKKKKILDSNININIV